MKFLSFTLIIFLVAVSGLTVTSAASTSSSCNLSKIQISTGTQTPSAQQVIVTATPSCWSGSVGINRGNVDTNLISVSVKNGRGSGQIAKIDTTQEVHPYANNPGMRGNNVIISCDCSGTGLTKLSISSTGSGKTETITINATPSTWAGTVEIVTSSGNLLTSATVPSSPGHATISDGSKDTETIHAVYSGIVSNSISLA